MPTMQTLGGSIVPPRCLACLLLVLCLLPVAVPASEEGRASGTVSGAGEARGREEHSPTDAERRPTERQAVRAAEPSDAGADDCPEWYRREKERLASLDLEANAAERRHQTWEAAKALLFAFVLGLGYYYAFKYWVPARSAFKRGKMLLVIWTDRDDGEEDLRRQEATRERYRKYMAEHPRQSFILMRQELPIFVKWGKRLARKGRAWRRSKAPQADTAAASWAAESEKFAADLLADITALDPQKEPTETPGESGMPNDGKAAPAKTGGYGPACAAARPPAVSRAEQYAEWKRQRQARRDKLE